MRTTGTNLLALTISQTLLWAAIAEPGDAAAGPPDGDWPYSASFTFQETVDGNPLSKGDEVYNLSGTYRYFVGPLGLKGTLAYAEPQNGASELQMLDLSVVWYANYHRQAAIFERGGRVKPELIFFAGPGWARQKTRGPRSVTEDFFTVNGGVGVNIHWFDKEDRSTSHWFLQPQLWGRWFTGGSGELDWGWGIGIGYGFGKRQTLEALKLRVRSCAGAATGFGELAVAEEHARYLEDLRAQVIGCGAERCPGLQEAVAGCISDFDRVLFGLRAEAPGG